jgi:carbamoyltransferase
MNNKQTTILGINAYHGDSSACLLVNGEVIAAVEEERLRRIKHWAGFPSEAIKYCLDEANIKPSEIDHIAVSRDPMARLPQKVWFTLRRRPSIGLLRSRLSALRRSRSIKGQLADSLGIDEANIGANVHMVGHHHSHSASAFLVSPYDEAAVVSIDAFGDFQSTLISHGEGHRMRPLRAVGFPHSLGILYTAVTQYLGFPRYGDEYKVMGLAAYGQPTYLEEFRRMVRPTDAGGFALDVDYFLHSTKGVNMTWDNCEPEIDRAYSDYMAERLGPARSSSDELTQRHNDLAASLQAVLEEIYFHVLNYAHEATGQKTLTLAGGVAFNSVANGKIFDKTPFEEAYIQAAAGDAGTALGSASYVYHQTLDHPRSFVMRTPYWGPSYDGPEIQRSLEAHGLKSTSLPEDDLLSRTAGAIADGKIVGWFQGRVEWGPRALGNRSILVDPRRAEMKEVLNQRIKRREHFRPFAPSILEESVGDYFERSYPDPFMIKVYTIKPEKRDEIPAVTHVDGTGRLQTVSTVENPRYWRLIKEFGRQTGVPVLLNTSFNENEPVVCSPEEAIDCFLRTKMDVLVLGDYYVEKSEES